MPDNIYPWGGKITRGNDSSTVAVVTLAEDWDLYSTGAAVWGNMRTENLGIEHVIANVISNPSIRFLIVAGKDIRGHRAGNTLVSLYNNGIDDNGRVIGADGAVPYIENLDEGAVERWQRQVELVNMVGETDVDRVIARIRELEALHAEPYHSPYIAMKKKVERDRGPVLGEMAAHRLVVFGPFGEVRPSRQVQGE